MKINKFIVFLFLCIISARAECAHRLVTITDDLSRNSDAIKTHHNDDNVISTYEIEIDTTVFYSNDTVLIQLEDRELIVVKKNSIKSTDINYSYNAYENDNNTHAYFSLLNGDIYGMIHSPSELYRIETYNQKHILQRININDIPEDSEPIIPHDIMDTMSMSLDDNSSPAIIRVLVMYTPEALLLRPNMLIKVFTDLNNGNTSFINSAVNARFELAYVGPTTDSEVGFTFEQLLEKFMDNQDGMFDEVHSLRSKYSADVCVLLVSASEYCGLGYINADYNYAFAVVRANSGCEGKYSFTHEIGHIIGCGHDMAALEHYSPYEYGHGYVHYLEGIPSSSWRTLMAYGDACSGEAYCTRIPYWSNPDVYYNGVATGTTTRENNARVWNERAIIVSIFRIPQYNINYTAASNNYEAIFESIKAVNQITTSGGYEIQSGQTVEMISPTIRLSAGTTIKEGAKFIARPNSSQNPYPQFITKNITDYSDKDNDYTDSNYINTSSSASKILRDGHIFIIRDNKTFTITGQKVE